MQKMKRATRGVGPGRDGIPGTCPRHGRHPLLSGVGGGEIRRSDLAESTGFRTKEVTVVDFELRQARPEPSWPAYTFRSHEPVAPRTASIFILTLKSSTITTPAEPNT